MVCAFQISNFVSGPPLKLYCILRLGDYAREKSRNGNVDGQVLILTRLSLLNFSLDLVVYLLAVSASWTTGDTQQILGFLASALLLLHCVLLYLRFCGASHVSGEDAPSQPSKRHPP